MRKRDKEAAKKDVFRVRDSHSWTESDHSHAWVCFQAALHKWRPLVEVPIQGDGLICIFVTCSILTGTEDPVGKGTKKVKIRAENYKNCYFSNLVVTTTELLERRE